MYRLTRGLVGVYVRIALTLILIPLSILFFQFFLGPSVRVAFGNAARIAFGTSFLWLLIGSTFVACVLYLYPLFDLAERGDCPDPVPTELPDRAVRRLNGLPWLVFGLNFLAFMSGVGFELLANQSRLEMGIEGWWIVMEGAVSGFTSAALMILHFDAHLFPLKRAVMAHQPSITLRYESLYGKVFLGLTALVIFLFFQSFTTISNFLVIGNRLGVTSAGGPGGPGRAMDFMRPDAVLGMTMKIEGMREALGLVMARGALFLVLTIDTLYLIRSLIQSPLRIVQRSLRGLTAGDGNGGEAVPSIDIVNNDEFRTVFAQINTLIRRQQSEIETSRARLDEIIQSAPDPILSFTPTGQVVLANPAARRLFSLPGSLTGVHIDTLVRLPTTFADHAPGSMETFLEHLDHAPEGLLRVQGLLSSGDAIPLEANASRTAAGDSPLYTLIARDIRSQVAFETGLAEAREAAERANALKSEFLANMSHELRTPLNAVLGFTQLMEGDKNLTEGQREKLSIISRSGEHLLGLINDILDISKIEAGKLELNTSAFDPRQLVEDLREMFSLRAAAKGLSLDLEVLATLPRAVEGDLGKLRQVLINLLGNSVKFTTNGGVGLVVGYDGPLIRFTVRDSGRGIPATEIAKALEPFGQSSLNRNEGGTGLGLAISARFVELMGGRLEVESSVGVGTTISFALPLPTSLNAPATRTAPTTVLGIQGNRHPRVLVVDDKQPNRLILKEFLERVGFTVMEAEDGQEAVERFRSFDPDLVFMDIKMPVMDGYDAAAAIAELNRRKVPLFALTASAFTHDEQRIRAAGFTDYLSKPFQHHRIFNLIEEHTDIAFMHADDVAGDTPSTQVQIREIDLAGARAALAPAFLSQLDDCITINDFGGVERLAQELPAEAPALLSRFLRERAAAFDEGALGDLMRQLHGENDG